MKAVFVASTLLLAVADHLFTAVEAHGGAGLAPQQRPAFFIRTTKECAAWNKLQQQASQSNSNDDDDDDEDDRLVMPAFYRVSSPAQVNYVRQTQYAYDRSQRPVVRQSPTELEFLENTVYRER